MTETTPEDDLEPQFSSARSKEIYEALLGVLCELDDPLTLAEQWAERVAVMQTSIERAKIVLGPIRRFLEEDENAIGLALLDGVILELDAALPDGSLSDLIKITNDLGERKIGFKSLTEQLDTTTASGRMIFHVFGAVAQFERDLISERTKAGLAAARARGKRGGRPAALKPKDIRIILQIMKDKTVSASDIAKRFGVSRATIQRGLRRHRETEEAKELDKLLKAQKRAARAGKQKELTGDD